MYSIFIIEDDKKIATILGEHLSKYQYDVSIARQFKNLKEEFLLHQPQLILLDINLPYFDGFYWCRQIRTVSNVPIIFISARTDEMNQILAVEHGGDDYITKPFNLEIVLAKIKSVLRRTYGEYALTEAPFQETVELHGLNIYKTKNELEYNGKTILLSQKEFHLFDCLAKKYEQIVSREDLLEALWDEVYFVDDNTLTVNVTRLRKRLSELGIKDAIQTVRGQGYRLLITWGKQQ